MSGIRPRAQTARAVGDAVFQNSHLSSKGLMERAFAFAFRGLVYAQIWEDPLIDMEAMEISGDSDIVTIASGGCNMLSYLTAGPGSLHAVDLNTAHVALGRLKIAAARHLPDHEAFHRFFAQSGQRANIAAYKAHVRPHLDDVTIRYWEGRDLIGRKRINAFARNIYTRGLLGQFISAAHIVARLYRIDPRELLSATSIEEQRAIFEHRLAPLFDRKFVRWLTQQPASLFGLGIPPAQYDALCSGSADDMAGVLRQRLEKLACDFDIRQNYFAQQAFGRGYADMPDAALPPYLEAGNHDALIRHLDSASIRHCNFVDYLARHEAGRFDRYALLDAQDWMTDAQLGALWSEITRTSRPGARVIFRTAAAPTLLPGRVSDAILGQWDYQEERSLDFTRRDRSAIYGGFHLYIRKGA
ncbi:MAG: DUF3419 family protein [Sphingomonadales bacterium]|nr:MAG: DUF3419 family protein [Sphingomonadales bacterium]TNF02772.1 MAG: DUF3419 family protein [Sphingomonadales bacterium]